MESLIKTLKKTFYVIGIDSQFIGKAKNYCDEFYLSPEGKSKKFISFLNKFSTKVDFIFLYVDEEIHNINKNREKLRKVIKKLVISEYKTIDICINKKKTNKYFQNTKINLPGENYSKKMIAKPIYGRGSKNLFFINSKKDYLFFKKKKNYIVQKYIKGKEYTVDCLYNTNSELVFSLARERIVHKGVSIVGKIVKNKKIQQTVFQISKLLNFYGPINIQLIQDKNGKIWLIEINPRLSGSVEFSIKAGFNPFLYFNRNMQNIKIKYGMVLKRAFNLSIG